MFTHIRNNLLAYITLFLTIASCCCIFLPAVVVECVSTIDDGLSGISIKLVIDGPEALFGGSSFAVVARDSYLREHLLLTSNTFDGFTFTGYFLLLGCGILGLFGEEHPNLAFISKTGLLISSILIFCQPIFFYVCSNLTDVTYFTYEGTKVYQSIGPILGSICALASFITYSIYAKMVEVDNPEEAR